MKIKFFKARNFLGLKEVEYSFEKAAPITLIEGFNHDAETATSNGAGKSSFFEAVLWGLYGYTKRGLKGDGVINRHNIKVGCEVAVGVSAGGVEYRILRTRGGADGNTLKLFSGGKDLSKGTVKETQSLIEDTIRISPLVFEKSVFFGQEDVKPFASLSDTDLKKVFEEVLNLTVLSECSAKVKTHGSVIAGLIGDEADEIDRLVKEAARLEGDAAKQAEFANETQSVYEKNKRGLEEDLARHNAQKEAVEGFLDKLSADTGREDKTAIEEQISTLNRAIEKDSELKDRLADKHFAERDAFSEANGEKVRLDSQIKTDQENIKTANSKIGQKCPTCGTPFDEKRIKEYIKNLAKKVSEYRDHVSRVEKTLAGAKVRRDRFAGYVDPLDKKIEVTKAKILALETRGKETETKLKEGKKKLSTAAEEVERKAKQIKDLEADRNTRVEGCHRKMDALFAERAEHQRDATKAEDKKKKLESKLEISEMLSEILSNQGLKSYVFDGITPELNATIERYMSMLDPAISVELSTVKKLKSGEFREKFGLSVTNQNGAGEYQGNSGGEKGKVNIAISLALNAIMRGVGADVGLCFFDEPFENLDAEASEAVVDLLKTIETENVYITSHNPAIRDLVSDTITIQKKGGFSTVVK